MPLYLDIHSDVDATPAEVEKLHLSDLEAQQHYGVHYLKYWFDQKRGRVCCLVEAPDPESAIAVHSEAHGQLADKIIEVESELLGAFLGGESENEVGCALYQSGGLDSGLRAVLFTDMVGSTELTDRFGDRRAMELLRVHDRLVRAALDTHKGREIKHTGDGIMASFVTPSHSIACAIAIQQAIRAHRKQSEDPPIRVRIGISAGEPVEEGDDLFGTTVQLASRLCDACAADGILVAPVLRDLCRGKEFAFLKAEEKTLKGMGEAVQTWRVVWESEDTAGQ